MILPLISVAELYSHMSEIELQSIMIYKKSVDNKRLTWLMNSIILEFFSQVAYLCFERSPKLTVCVAELLLGDSAYKVCHLPITIGF